MKEELIGTIPVPEGYIVKRSRRGDGEVLYEFLKDNKKASDFRDLVDRGQIRSQPSEFAEDSLITMTSELEHELQRKGLARAAYKDAENVTGRKIIPDKILTSKSAGLHKKYGLGNEFGLSDYEPVFKEGVKDWADKHNKAYPGGVIRTVQSSTPDLYLFDEIHEPPMWPEEVADIEYKKIKAIMKEYGMDKFKSIIPLLKTLGKAVPFAGAAMAPSADAAVTDFIPGGVEELGRSEEQKDLDLKYLKRIRQLSEKK